MIKGVEQCFQVNCNQNDNFDWINPALNVDHCFQESSLCRNELLKQILVISTTSEKKERFLKGPKCLTSLWSKLSCLSGGRIAAFFNRDGKISSCFEELTISNIVSLQQCGILFRYLTGTRTMRPDFNENLSRTFSSSAWNIALNSSRWSTTSLHSMLFPIQLQW